MCDVIDPSGLDLAWGLRLGTTRQDLTERGFKWKNDEGRMQHDAHELIRLLIDRLERDMKLSKVNAGLVSALYEGDLANQV